MVVEADIRIHIGAPSRRKDDERTREQATTYLNTIFRATTDKSLDSAASRSKFDSSIFEADRSNIVCLHADRLASKTFDIQKLGITRDLSSCEMTSSNPTHLRSNTSFLDASQPDISVLESQLTGSSLQIFQDSVKPGFKRTYREHLSAEGLATPNDGIRVMSDAQSIKRVRYSGSGVEQLRSRSSHPDQTSTESLNSELSQVWTPSSHFKSPELEKFAINIGKHKQLPQRRPVGESLLRRSSITQNKTATPAKGSHVPPGFFNRHKYSSTTSEMPSTYNLSGITSNNSQVIVPSLQRSLSDPNPMSVNESSRLVSDPVPGPLRPFHQLASTHTRHVLQGARLMPKIDQVGNTHESQDGHSKLEPDEDMDPHSRQQSPEAHTTQEVDENTFTDPEVQRQNLVTTLKSLPRFVPRPTPETSTDRLETFVTEPLRRLAEDSVVSNKYKPVLVKREILKEERGYWLINTSSWDLQLQLNFWNSLTYYVANGSTSWFVSIARGGDDEATGKDMVLDVDGLGDVKVFCFGEIVKHVYLVLYVASLSKVSHSGLEWKDAGKEVVVEMRRST